MHLAASGGHYELMQFLFTKGGSVEDEDKVKSFTIISIQVLYVTFGGASRTLEMGRGESWN